ncbi:TLR4 interactor with leucine rich repeats [Trichomycterus rosablanca]|uniref:TLR4 interactor with leucine rich repeats n=1 Tax=Trichomycterus rosablanca TaxID=2290929 RepID=UPI002F356898
MEKRETTYPVLWATGALAVLLCACSACPEPCECPRFHQVLCANRGLRAVPHTDRNVRTFGLAGNFISNLTHLDLFNFNQLTSLDLQFNQIQTIDPHAFSKLISLEELYLGHNQISAVQPGTFESLKKLTVLYGNNNNIKDLTADTFKNLESVFKLRLDKNLIEQLNESVFRLLPSLMFLHLESNNLHHIHSSAFSNLEKLQFLNLSDNKQTNLSDMFMFSNLKSLMTLLISANQIRHVSNHVFENLHKLTKLSLSNNKIVKLDYESLKGLSRLRELNFDHNMLTDIPEGLLEPLERLEHLDLSHNRIKHVDPAAFGHLAHLKVLNLSDNQLARLSGRAFASNSKLFQLDLSGNMWTCDCGLEKLKDWMVKTHTHGKLLTTLVRCHHPPTLKGKYLDYVNITELLRAGNSSSYCQVDQEAQVGEGQGGKVINAQFTEEERLRRGGDQTKDKMVSDSEGGRKKPTRKRKNGFRPRSRPTISDSGKTSSSLALLGTLTTKIIPSTTGNRTIRDHQKDLTGTQKILNSLPQKEAEHYELKSTVGMDACQVNRHYISNVSIHDISSDTATVSWSTVANLRTVQGKALMFRVLFDRFGHAIRFPRYVYTDGAARVVTLQELRPDSTYIACVESVVSGTLCQVAPRDHCIGFVTMPLSGRSEIKLQYLTAAVLVANALLLLFVVGVWLGRTLRRWIKSRKSAAHTHVRHMYSTRRPFRSAMPTTCVSSEFSGYQSGRPLAEEGDLIQFPVERFFDSSCSRRDDDTMMQRF